MEKQLVTANVLTTISTSKKENGLIYDIKYIINPSNTILHEVEITVTKEETDEFAGRASYRNGYKNIQSIDASNIGTISNMLDSIVSTITRQLVS